MKELNHEYAFEALGERLDRTNRRLFIIVLILISALITTNVGWLYYTSQFSVEETTMIEAEQDGELNIIGGGDVNYGTESPSN